MSLELIDPPATAERPASAHRQLLEPEVRLWELQMELALQRINIVLEFARNWLALKQSPDYELERARCVFHLEWIFDDVTVDQFTFRELCRFSRVTSLLDVGRSRRRIREAFCLDAAREMELPVGGRLRKHVRQAWLNSALSHGISRATFPVDQV